MFGFVKTASSDVWMRWKDEWNTFWKTREELFDMEEFWIALIFSSVYILAFPICIFAEWDLTVFAILCLPLLALWFVGLGFITAGGVLFDNIPFFADASSAVDTLDGVGLKKAKRIASVLEKKEHAEDKISLFLQRTLIYFTVTSFRKSKHLLSLFSPLLKRATPYAQYQYLKLIQVMETLNVKERNFIYIAFIGIPMFFARFIGFAWGCIRIAFAFAVLGLSCAIFIAPIATLATIGSWGILVNIKPSIARLPIILPAVSIYAALSCVPFLLSLLHISTVWGTQTFYQAGLFLGLYTFFFVQKEDLFFLKKIYQYVVSQEKIAFKKF